MTEGVFLVYGLSGELRSHNRDDVRRRVGEVVEAVGRYGDRARQNTDNELGCAENQVAETFENIYKSSEDTNIYIPKIFIRVREPEQVLRVFRLIRDYHTLLTGFIFPKYSVDNAAAYNQALLKVNEISSKKYI